MQPVHYDVVIVPASCGKKRQCTPHQYIKNTMVPLDAVLRGDNVMFTGNSKSRWRLHGRRIRQKHTKTIRSPNGNASQAKTWLFVGRVCDVQRKCIQERISFGDCSSQRRFNVGELQWLHRRRYVRHSVACCLSVHQNIMSILFLVYPGNCETAGVQGRIKLRKRRKYVRNQTTHRSHSFSNDVQRSSHPKTRTFDGSRTKLKMFWQFPAKYIYWTDSFLPGSTSRRHPLSQNLKYLNYAHRSEACQYERNRFQSFSIVTSEFDINI